MPMQSRQTIHLPSGSASNQVQPAPEQVGHLSFSAIARSLCAIDQAYIADGQSDARGDRN
ncbi:MAG TPA: hypothetical protein VN804_02575 [Solirubrobacteraceae bacterium]|nr:hypothetical protein [Solirubrobacteraceae bacterium]